MFNFLLCTVSIRVSACISKQTFVSVVYCRVFLSCIVVYYPINYRVCSFVYFNTRYTIQDTWYTKISCIKSETLICLAHQPRIRACLIRFLPLKLSSFFCIFLSLSRYIRSSIVVGRFGSINHLWTYQLLPHLATIL